MRQIAEIAPAAGHALFQVLCLLQARI